MSERVYVLTKCVVCPCRRGASTYETPNPVWNWTCNRKFKRLRKDLRIPSWCPLPRARRK